MSRVKLSRREREKSRHKEEISEAALTLFSEKGFHNVSMQDIAVASEFGVGTLYNFFESKDDLFEELLNAATGQIINELVEILDGPGSETNQLAAFIMHQPILQEKYGKVIKLYVSQVGIKGSKLSRIKDENKVHEVVDSKLAKIIKQGIRKGLFRDVDPEITAKAIASIIETLIFETTGRFDRDTVTGMFQKVKQLFLDGLLV